MKELFGTDGIRGTTDYSSEASLRLTPELILRVGQAIGQIIREHLSDGGEDAVVIGRDPRISGMMLESALTAGLLSQGVDVVQAGVLPTPAVALLTRRLGSRLGVVISASHNPVEDNGIKLFGPQGYKLEDDLEEHIQAAILDPDQAFSPCDTQALGRIRAGEHLQETYIDHLVQSWRAEDDLSDLLVLLECTNGATSHVAPQVFERLGARFQAFSCAPDGLNINKSYEYVTPQRFGELVVDKGADIGMAFDGDGDRVILVDERGQVIDGDVIMAILARYMLAQDRLPGETVVTTHMSNYGLHDSLQKVGVEVVETRVGDRFVMQKMLTHGYTLGGERSGHILLLDEGQTTGDGIYTALAVASAMVDQDASLSELASVMQRYPQFIESANVPPEKPPLEENAQVQDDIAQLQNRLGAHADINVRYSGTEDKLRLSVRGRGGDDLSLMRKEARKALRRIAQAISAQALES